MWTELEKKKKTQHMLVEGVTFWGEGLCACLPGARLPRVVRVRIRIRVRVRVMVRARVGARARLRVRGLGLGLG